MTAKRFLNKIALFCLLLISLFSDAFAQERKLYPLDEGVQEPTFNAFRKQLLKAAKERDGKFILSVLDSKIQNSFGGDGGIKEFKEQWEIDSPNSRLWDELTTILLLGGSFEDKRKRQFNAPYVFAIFPEDLDAFEYSVIVGEDVDIREQPNLSSPIITKLSYNIVKVDYENSILDETKQDSYSWIKIETPSGATGFIIGKHIRSSIDYRIGFVKAKGRWKIIFFLAGD